MSDVNDEVPATTPVETEETNSSILTDDAPSTDNINDSDGVSDNQDAESSTEAESSDNADADENAGGDDQSSPESYSDFTLPEGIEMDQLALDKALPIFKEIGLSQEQAQKLVDLQAEQVQEGIRSQTEQFSQLMNDWVANSKADKEFGGERFEESVSTARLAMDKFGTDEFKQLMEDHGVGNHPEMIRFMWNVGKMLKEDVPGDTGNNPTDEKSRVDILYPKG